MENAPFLTNTIDDYRDDPVIYHAKCSWSHAVPPRAHAHFMRYWVWDHGYLRCNLSTETAAQIMFRYARYLHVALGEKWYENFVTTIAEHIGSADIVVRKSGTVTAKTTWYQNNSGLPEWKTATIEVNFN